MPATAELLPFEESKCIYIYISYSTDIESQLTKFALEALRYIEKYR